MHTRTSLRGMSFMDVIIGTALMLIIFTALIGLLRTSLQVASLAKTRSIATTIAEGQMEYIRSLSYDQVGTVGGIPSGTIAQNASTTQNGISFPIRTLIEYVDDPADGTGSGDANGITTDYKRIKVSVTYFANNRSQTVDLVSNYAPPGLETTTGGGTLKVIVVNATGAGVAGASVHVVNSSVSPAIDLTTFSDSLGVVFLPGAPTSTQYQIGITKSGYSSAQTYARDATNQNPTPGYLTVVKNQTTTSTFAIDLLSNLNVHTFSPVATSTFADTFSSGAGVASTNNTLVSGGAVRLTSDVNGYSLSGTVASTAQSPTYLAGWGTAVATTSLPGGTTIRFHVTNGAGVLLPDTALPGNASGFTSTASLSGLSTSTYPTLALSADLSTISTTTTPLLQDWSISYARGPIPFPAVPFVLTGTKTVGSTGAGAPIYKTSVSNTTDASGNKTATLEWDGYTLALTAYDVVSACNAPPYSLSPGSTSDTSLMVSTSTTNMILVSVRDTNGGVPGTSVTLSRSGFTKTVTTDSCGSAYFGSLSSASYDLTASKTGYTTFNVSGITISGHVFYPVTME
jgi:hypothetical protein